MQEIEKSDYGTIRISRDAIISIAHIATISVDGVRGIRKNFFEKLLEAFGISVIISGMQVKFEEKQIQIHLFLIAKYGVNLPDLACKVQESVKSALEKMAQTTNIDVDVDIVGVEKGEK